MRAGQRLIVVLCSVAGALMVASPAAANESPGGSGGAFVDASGSPTAVATDGEQASGGGGGGDDPCEWSVVIADDFDYALYEIDGRRLYSETGRWLQRLCNGASQSVNGSYLVPEGGQADPAAIASGALASVPIATPPMTTSPSANDRLYTQVRTWLWVPAEWWRSYSATASAGRVTSTVTASPVRAEWASGDGGGTTCRGPGVEWRRGMRDDATYCSYTYRHSSAGEPGDSYTLAVTVWFQVTWTSNTGQAGALGDISRGASRQVQVGEIQAMETE